MGERWSEGRWSSEGGGRALSVWSGRERRKVEKGKFGSPIALDVEPVGARSAFFK